MAMITNEALTDNDIMALLKIAADQGVFLFTEGGQLKFKLSVSEFPAEIKTRILSIKPQLIEFLSKRNTTTESTATRITPVEDQQQTFAMSFAQQRLWFIDKLQGNSSQYNMTAALDVVGKIDLDIVEEVMNHIVSRHTPLRSCYEQSAEGGVQFIQTGRSLTLQRIDISHLDEQLQQQEINRLTATELKVSFDLARDLMLRVSFIICNQHQGVMLINMHHIASDGWSLAVLTQEFISGYQSRINGQPIALPPLEISYLDYAHWQRSDEYRLILDKQLAYWQQKLANAPQYHSLPLDFVRPKVQSMAGRMHHTPVNQALSEQISQLAKQQGVSVFMLLHGAFSLLLSRYSGSQDILIGTPVANRLNPQLAPLIGLFVNTVVLRTDCSENIPFSEYLKQVKEVNIDALNHQQTPFELVVDKLMPQRNLAYSPIFQIMLTMDFDKLEETTFADLRLSSKSTEQLTSKFDLTLHVTTEPAGLALSFEYCSDLFEAETIEQLGRHFVALLSSIVETPDGLLNDLSIISPIEKQQLIATIAPEPALQTPEQHLLQLFDAQVASVPNNIALYFERQQLSYAQLDSKANQLAQLLLAQGVQAETLVGLSVSRSLDMVVAILAILKSGGAYVPLDPAYPAERLSYMINNSRLGLILSHSEIEMPDLPSHVVRLNMDKLALDGYSTDKPKVTIQPAQLAYIIYTSGSTGQPKGVMVEHRNVCRLFSVCQRDFQFNEKDVWCLFHSYAFDFSVWEIWGALAYGGRLVIVPQWVSRSSGDFYQLVSDQQVTILNQTPTAFNQFKQVDSQQRHALALRAIVFGGEALNLSELTDWLVLHNDTDVMLVNMYGITETTVHVTFRRILRQDIEANKGSLIGRPLADLSVFVLDNGLQPVPMGVVGEMFVGGKGVSRGYLHQPELTAERFIDNPFCPAERLYRTGDLARQLKSGDLEYLGRIDEQVKIRGFRIELGEIEQQISAQAEIDSCVVVVHETIDNLKQLLAYIKPQLVTMARDEDQNEQLKAQVISECRRQLRENLPVHMIPAIFVVVEQWPLTANGKINKKMLPPPQLAALQAQYVAPTNDQQQILCDVWQSVLKIERIGIDDNFFNIGGDSILSIQIVSELKNLGYSLSVKQLFEYQSIAELAQHIQKSDHSDQSESITAFDQLTEAERTQLIELHGEDFQAKLEDAYPLSSLQAGMVFHTQLADFSGVYHDIMAEHIKCPWNEDLFRQALMACVNNHPILRSTFVLSCERPIQQVFRQYDAPLIVDDLRAMSVELQDEFLHSWTETRKRHVFQWTEGPLYQVAIFLRSDDSFEFVVSFHHAILDGWSRAVLSTELYDNYQHLLKGLACPAMSAEWLFRDFIALEQQVIGQHSIIQHFQQMLADAPLQQVPYKLSADVQAPRWQQSCEVIEIKPMSEALLNLAKQLSVPIQHVLLAVHFKVLSLLSGERQVVSCVTHNGRPEAQGADRGLGLFLNSLPLSLSVAPMSWRELIAQVSELAAQNMAYRRFPMAEIQKHVGREFSEVTFNYTHFHIYENLAGDKGNDFELLGSNAFEQTNFDFHVDIARSWQDDKFNMFIHFNGHLFDMAQIEQIKGYYLSALQLLLDDPSISHHQVSLLSKTEQQMLQNWSSAPSLTDNDPLSVQFLQQVTKTPDALAVIADQIQLTYRQLNHLVQRLAAYLQEMEIGHNNRVGLLLPRSIAQIVGLLGVNLAGAAFVPLEPSLPSNRLNFMIKDADIELVLLPSALMDSVSLAGVDVLIMDQVLSEQWLDEYEDSFEFVPAPSCSQAYVLYTSGSTGQPKGVLIGQENLSHYLSYAQSQYMAAHICGSVVSSPLCFDATLTSLLTPLTVGKAVCLLADGDQAMVQLPEYLFNSDTHWLFKLTPAHLDALVDSYDPEQQQHRLTAQHIIVIGGEQLRVSTLAEYKKSLLPNSCFINEYGPTETVVGTSVFCVDNETNLTALAQHINVPIGKPIAGSNLYVVGIDDQLQPVNSPGQLYIGGAGVAHGYLNLTEQTAQQFVSYKGQRVYKSGDLVRWLPDGNLSFIGRVDKQVKLNGYRIEPGEIDKLLLTLPGVSNAHVVVQQNGQGDAQLVAYLLAPNRGLKEMTLECRRLLSANLPEYMVPSHFVLVDEMPLTVNGKLDIAALPAITVTSQEKDRYEGPGNPMEQQICQIFERVLNQAPIGIRDNFFALGGDSIKSIRVVSLLKREGIHLDIKDIFACQTVAAIAQFLAQQTQPKSSREAVTAFALLSEEERQIVEQMNHSQIVDAYPMSTLQAGMVYHTQLENFNGIYHDINAEHIKCPWHYAHFVSAFEACIETHPVLRTGYYLAGERPLQLVYESIELPLVIEDIRSLNATEQQQHLHDWVASYKNHVFDWLNGPLHQINIFLRSDDSFEFVFSFHHAVLDGWSRASFSTELYNHYYRLLANEPISPSAPQWLYREYIALELEALAQPQAKNYFAEMVEQAPARQLPVYHEIENDKTGQGQFIVKHFNERSAALIDLAGQLGTPVHIVLMAIHYKFLSTLSGQNTVMSCVVCNGRPELEGGETGLGLYLNSLPMVVTLSKGSWRDLIKHLFDINNTSMGYRHYPLAKIQQDSGLTFSEVLFNYTHFHIFQDLATDDSAQSLEMLGTTGFEQTNFDLLCDIQRGFSDDLLNLTLVYNQALFDGAQMSVFGDTFLAATDALLRDVDSNVHHLSLLSRDQIDQQMSLWQGEQRSKSQWQYIHQGFEAQATANPNSLAVLDQSQQLSYQQLNQRANQLALWLKGYGMVPGDFIGISIEPSVDMLVAVLAVLKAGCAYVPLDINYPNQRLIYLCQDSGIKCSLSHTNQQLPDELAKISVHLDAIDLNVGCADSLDTLPEQALAYMIYTSGSTGKPKGVLVPHYGVVNYLAHVSEQYLQPHHAGAVVSSPLSFDATVTSLLAPLWQGKSVVVLKQNQQDLVDGLLNYLLSDNQHWLFKLTPAHLELLLPLCRGQQSDKRHTLVLGGEQLLMATVADWQTQVLPQAIFINEYGPTETTVGCTFYCHGPADSGARTDQAMPIGRPIRNTQLWVLNEDRQLLPPGTTGQLYIGGDGVTQGYHQRLDLTENHFVESDFIASHTVASKSSVKGKLYRTGDLARYLPDGQLMFVGRQDHQVKIRGYRIEPGEIAAQISLLADIKEAVVLYDKSAGELVAYLVSNQQDGSLPEDQNHWLGMIKAQLADSLPAYMLPSQYLVLPVMPLTANGKVDRKALAAMSPMSQPQIQYVAPSSELEVNITEIWQKVLKQSPISVNASFFEIGGHSLLATRLLSLLQVLFSDSGIEVTLSMMFEFQTIAQFAKHIEQQQLLQKINQNKSLFAQQESEDFEEEYL